VSRSWSYDDSALNRHLASSLHRNSAARWIASLALAMTVLHSGTFRWSYGLRAQPNFLSAINLFLPVQPRRKKYSASLRHKSVAFATRLDPLRGVSRSSRSLGRRCGGRGWRA
jgi:hypothetical protein